MKRTFLLFSLIVIFASCKGLMQGELSKTNERYNELSLNYPGVSKDQLLREVKTLATVHPYDNAIISDFDHIDDTRIIMSFKTRVKGRSNKWTAYGSISIDIFNERMVVRMQPAYYIYEGGYDSSAKIHQRLKLNPALMEYRRKVRDYILFIDERLQHTFEPWGSFPED